MKSAAHTSVGLCFGSICASFYADRPEIEFGINELTGAALFAVVLGANSPDLDSEHARISKILPWASILIRRRWSHREGVHSGAGLAVATAIFGAMAMLIYSMFEHLGRPLGVNYSYLLSVLFGAGFLSHLILDTWTKTGVRWTWPSPDRWVLPPGERYRARTGDLWVEIPLTVISLALFVFLIQFTLKGAITSAREYGGFEGLRKSYAEIPNREMVLAFEGFFEEDRSLVSGRGLILAAQSNVFIVYFDGQIHYLGEDSGDLRLLSGALVLLDRAPQVLPLATYKDNAVADILADLAAKGNRTLISGELYSNEAFEFTRPYNQRTLSVTSKAVLLDFAQVADIRALQIRPTDTGVSAAELAQGVARVRALEDSLVSGMKRTADYYERKVLFERIKETRQELKILKKRLEKTTQIDTTIRFSGHLSVRLVPRF